MENTLIRETIALGQPRRVLEEIAKNMGISTSGMNKPEIERRIIKNLDRKEGYTRLLNY